MSDIFMNVRIDEYDAKMVERMMQEDFIDNRSVFIRRLIRQEWARRYSQPNGGVTVGEALDALKAIQKEE